MAPSRTTAASMITAPEQRFRSLFHALDAEKEWSRLLTSSQLQYARTAAKTPETWLSFLAGTPRNIDHDAMDDDSEPSFSPDETWNISGIVRKRITFAAIDEDFFTTPPDDREDDHGLMPGDDRGYTDYAELLREERALQREKNGVFRLLAYQGTDVSELPKPLFAGRVRELLTSIEDMCKDNVKAAIVGILEIERCDGYDTVEACLTAVGEFVSTHGDALAESREKVETMIDGLRKEYDEFLEWHERTVAENDGLTGVLGVATRVIEGVDRGSGRGYDEDSVEYRGSGDAAAVAVAKRPRVPVFGGNARRRSDGRSLWEMLGPGNAVVKNVGLYERVMKLKKEMYRLQDMKDGRGVKEEDQLEEPKEPETELIEVGDELHDHAVTRERRMGESFVGLLLSHTGFSHADERALECVTDVFEEFVQKIGRELISCRENIDNNGASVAEHHGRMRGKNRDELLMELEIVMDCVNGGFAELYNYVRADMMRTEHALREVEIRLKDRVQRLGGTPDDDVVDEEIDGSNFISEDDIVLDGDEFAFGYLGKGVWLDVLGGVKVPREMVYGHS